MAGSIDYEHFVAGKVRRIVITWLGDAATGDVPNLVLPLFEGHLIELVTHPDTPAPTDLYDVAITDQDGVDRLQGLGADRSTSDTEVVPIFYTDTDEHVIVSRSHQLTLAITNQAVAAATGTVTLLYLAA